MADTSIDQARRLLTAPERRASPWAALAAAGLAAPAAGLMAGGLVLGPGVRFVGAVAAEPLFPNG